MNWNCNTIRNENICDLLLIWNIYFYWNGIHISHFISICKWKIHHSRFGTKFTYSIMIPILRVCMSFPIDLYIMHYQTTEEIYQCCLSAFLLLQAKVDSPSVYGNALLALRNATGHYTEQGPVLVHWNFCPPLICTTPCR